MESDQGEKKAVTIDGIIDGVGRLYGLTADEITAGGKQRCPSRGPGHDRLFGPGSWRIVTH